MNFYPDRQKYLTTAGPIEVISTFDLANHITIEQVHHTMPILYPSQKKVEILDFEGFDSDMAIFEKKEIKCKPFASHRAVNFIERSLHDLNFEHASVDLTLASNWDEVVDRAATSSIENFGQPTHACVLPGNKLLLADINGDVIRFMWGYNDGGETVGALVALHPMKLIVASFGPAAAMGSFVAKLGLR